jgi:photosystem II stability/assembly factor-like uncharacterized protein
MSFAGKKTASIVIMSNALSQFCFYSIQSQEWKKIDPVFQKPGMYNMSLGLFVDEKNGWFTEEFPGRTWQTIDGGYHWKMQKDSSAVWSYNIDFADKFHGWIIGKRIPDYLPLLWKTTDGGNNWYEFMIPEELITLTFKDSLNGFSGGENIYQTTDGGETWQKSDIRSEVSFGVWDIYFVDRQFGWATGGSNDLIDAGIILKTTDGGVTWQVNLHPSGAVGRGVYFTDRLHGVVVGSNPPIFEGVVMRTEDGGDHWMYQYLPCTWLRDVVFTDDSTGWIVGDYGIIWKTGDRGKTWEWVESGTMADLKRIIFVENGKVGFIFGDKNTLLRYSEQQDGVKEKRTGATPSRFELFPNFPNPFNGETRIAYVLSDEEYIDLRIFDITGKEVITLVDGVQEAGRHSVIWNSRDKDGREVPSGICILRLRSGDKAQTEKVTLIH